MKKKIIIAISAVLILLQYSCKECYSCTNNCCLQESTQAMICNTEFVTNEEYFAVLDSLQGDIECGYVNVEREACSDEEKNYIESTERLGCMKKRKK